MGTTQECFKLFWINSGSNTTQNSSDTTTYLPSPKSSKKDEQGVLEEQGWTHDVLQ